MEIPLSSILSPLVPCGARRKQNQVCRQSQRAVPAGFSSTTRTLFRGILFLFALVAVTAAGLAAETNSPARPASWAKPLTAAGIKNFYQVTTNLYRGAQPTAEGMKQLKAMGIKTVINLRAYHSDKDEVAGTGLKSVHFEAEPWHAEEEDVIRFLKVVADTNNLPAFVHCQRGADRTGMMCAMHRICVGGWTKPEAIKEMKEGGFGFNPSWRNLARFIEQADVEKFKREAGISANARIEDGK
jgi:protein tyrosine phosphatase (PTP) superfamily phosphohydrolase (DUF442 family)